MGNRQKAQLMGVHRNLGHPSNKLYAQILREAKAPETVIKAAETLSCPICDRFKRSKPSRPAKPQKARELGECLAVDFSYHRMPNGKRFLLANFIDEASRFHVGKVIKEAFVESDAALGNCDAESLLESLQSDWIRWMASPKRIHVDSEGVFAAGKLAEFCGRRNIRIVVCGGEAHWQLGIVERHIGTLKDTLEKMMLEDCNANITPQELVDMACEAKNFCASHGGFSPANWMLGRQHPLLRSGSVPPSLVENSDFEMHIARKTKAAQAFHYADARSLLRLAANARSRTLLHPEPGTIVYYLRRGKGTKRPYYRGPARVLACEHPESGTEALGTSVVWLSHAGVLIRAAPEHLRMATPVEVSAETAIRGDAAPPGLAIHRTVTGKDNSRYVDLGPTPTATERAWAGELVQWNMDLHPNGRMPVIRTLKWKHRNVQQHPTVVAAVLEQVTLNLGRMC